MNARGYVCVRIVRNQISYVSQTIVITFGSQANPFNDSHYYASLRVDDGFAMQQKK